MGTVRIIPRLDIKGPNLVKGIHLEGLRVLGKPEDFARYYYENGADELLFVDVVASLYERNSLEEMILKTAKDIFIPLTVGGGIRTLNDISRVLKAGADKVSINTAAIRNPGIIKEASRTFGSSTIVATIEAIKQPDGSYLAYTDNGREHSGMEVATWAKILEELGAGELIITSVDREGTGRGFDIELTKLVSNVVSVPVVAHGGAGKLSDIAEIINVSGVSAVTMASTLHYFTLKEIVYLNNDGEGNTDFLKSGRSFSKTELLSIPKIKSYLEDCNILVRN